MISNAEIINQECGICYKNSCMVGCNQCSFVICIDCSKKLNNRISSGTIKNQCPQCFKQGCWMKNLVSYESYSPIILSDCPVIINTQRPSVQRSDLENQLDHHLDRKCIGVHEKLNKIFLRLIYILMGIFLCCVTGFIFFAANGNANIFYDAISENNTNQIIILIMMYGLSGLFILLGCLFVVIFILSCCGCIYIAAQDNS